MRSKKISNVLYLYDMGGVHSVCDHTSLYSFYRAMKTLVDQSSATSVFCITNGYQTNARKFLKQLGFKEFDNRLVFHYMTIEEFKNIRLKELVFEYDKGVVYVPTSIIHRHHLSQGDLVEVPTTSSGVYDYRDLLQVKAGKDGALCLYRERDGTTHTINYRNYYRVFKSALTPVKKQIKSKYRHLSDQIKPDFSRKG